MMILLVILIVLFFLALVGSDLISKAISLLENQLKDAETSCEKCGDSCACSREQKLRENIGEMNDITEKISVLRRIRWFLRGVAVAAILVSLILMRCC